MQLFYHLLIDRIAVIRPMEGNNAHPMLFTVKHCFIVHPRPIPFQPRISSFDVFSRPSSWGFWGIWIGLGRPRIWHPPCAQGPFLASFY